MTSDGFASRLRRVASRAAGQVPGRAQGPAGQVDSCWALDDGSLCIDGWCLTLDTDTTGLDARVRGDDQWTALIRKARPDVALAFGMPSTVASANVGFVGRVPTHGDLALPIVLEFRSPQGFWDFQVVEFATGPVPEDVFVGLVIDSDVPSPGQLQPIADVMAHSTRPPPPSSRVAYEHSSFAGRGRLNVVVPVYREFRYLRNLMLALDESRGTGVELTVVCDDPSISDDLVDWMRTWNDAVYRLPAQLVVHETNAGFAAACNSGWRASQCTVQLLLNSDVVIANPRRDFDLLIESLVAGAAAVAPTLLFPDGLLQHAGMAMEESTDFPGFTLPMHPGKGEPADDLPGVPFGAPLLSGAAILATSDLLHAVGGVPSVYGRGDFEDVLFSVALQEHGGLVVDPRVRWTHVEGASYRRELHGGVPVTLAKSLVIRDRLAGRA